MGTKAAELDFDLAFDQAMDVPDTVTDEPETNEAPAEEPPAEEPAAEEPPVEEPPVEEPQVEVPAAEAKPAVDPMTARVAALEKELADARKPPVVEKPVEKKEEPLLSDTEKAAMTELESEWPELNAGLEVKLKVIKNEIAAQIRNELANFQKTLAPALSTVGKIEADTFRSQLLSAHADTDTIFPQVEAWVNTQPERIKAAYNDIIDTGTAQEVSALFTMYKQVAGVTTPMSAQPPVTAKKPVVVPPSAEKTKRLDQLSAVRTERTGVSAEIDPNDFDSAFERAAHS